MQWMQADVICTYMYKYASINVKSIKNNQKYKIQYAQYMRMNI